MNILDRHQIDGLVRDLGPDVYGLALARGAGVQQGKALVLEAFGEVARDFPRTSVDVLRRKLYARIKPRDHGDREREVAISPVPMPADLHLQVVDLVEERQSDEPTGRKKVFLGVAGAGAVLAAIGLFAYIHWSALAAATPTIRDIDPAANATAAPVDGALHVNFDRAPSTKPVITLQPKDGQIDAGSWAGGSLLTEYHGLQPATRYTVTLEADYRSGLKDVGHFTHQWSFTTEGYPAVTGLLPADGQLIAFRNGELQIGFDRRPSIQPRVSLSPATGIVDSGRWNGTSWTIAYHGLAPLSWYEATVSLDYGTGHPKISRTWRFQTEPGNPPSGTPVMWFTAAQPGDRDTVLRLTAIDWNGNLVGTAYLPGYLRQSPGGSLLSNSDGMVLDAGGKVIGQLSSLNFQFADDDRSLCQLTGSPGNAMTLLVGPAQGPFRKVLTVPAPDNVMVTGCSVLHDRVVLVHFTQMGPGQALEVEVVRPSNGGMILRRSYSLDSSVSVTASPDGAYLAEATAALSAGNQPSSWTTTIRRTSDGAVVTRLINQRVLAFSWDGRRILTAPQVPGDRNEFDLIDLLSGQMLWRLPGGSGTDGSQPAYAMPQPNGDGMLLAVATNPSTSDLNQLWRVSKEGTAELLLSQVLYPVGA